MIFCGFLNFNIDSVKVLKNILIYSILSIKFCGELKITQKNP